MKPIVGMPLCLDDRDRWRVGRAYHYIHDAYAKAVCAAGGVPLYLPVQPAPADLVARLDGLLLPGGDDFAPTTPYPDDVAFVLTPPAQLNFDRALLAAAVDRALPILGICYGAQLMVQHFGGQLHYHLPHDVPEAGEHRLGGDRRHGLRVAPDSRLARVLGADPGPVNSLHHQGIADAGPGLRACAWSDDGLIEGVERAGEPFCLGVEWHPEMMDGPHCTALFDAFVAACRTGAPA